MYTPETSVTKRTCVHNRPKFLRVLNIYSTVNFFFSGFKFLVSFLRRTAVETLLQIRHLWLDMICIYFSSVLAVSKFSSELGGVSNFNKSIN